MDLCKYKNIFGKEREGAHSVRILGMAAVDVFATIALAMLISWWSKTNLILVFAVCIILSIFVHRLFCVKTTLTSLVFY